MHTLEWHAWLAGLPSQPVPNPFPPHPRTAAPDRHQKQLSTLLLSPTTRAPFPQQKQLPTAHCASLLTNTIYTPPGSPPPSLPLSLSPVSRGTTHIDAHTHSEREREGGREREIEHAHWPNHYTLHSHGQSSTCTTIVKCAQSHPGDDQKPEPTHPIPPQTRTPSSLPHSPTTHTHP
jgi:hypothetical protein